MLYTTQISFAWANKHSASETETSNTESLEAVGDRHEQTDTETTTELTSNEEVTTTVREYDTDKPTDPVTGTPPLKRETTQTRRKTDA